MEQGNYMVMLSALPMLCTFQMSQGGTKPKNSIDRGLAYSNSCKINTEIKWLTEPKPILDLAKKQGKLILFINMLGSMSGNT
jgi:hypothetical protein